MAYRHCVPAVEVSEPYGSDQHKGLVTFSKGRQNSTLAVVDLAIHSTNELQNRKNTSTHHYASQSNRPATQHTKGFPPSTPSSRVQFQQRRAQATEDLLSGTPERKSTKNITVPEAKREVVKPGRKSGSASLVEKVYKPTLPKYCFSASTYQNVLTDYASSGSYGVAGDLSQLPPPRHTLMTRELPYVYRFKIQQGITSLNQMIPTKRLHTSDNIW